MNINDDYAFNFMQFNSMIPLMVFYPLSYAISCAHTPSADCRPLQSVKTRANVPQRKSPGDVVLLCLRNVAKAAAVSFYKHLNWSSIHPLIDCVQEAMQRNAATANEELSHCTFDRQRRTEELFRPFIQLIVIQSQHLTEYLIILIQEYQARTEAATTSS